ncbi:MAG TPA: penicillin-binding protein activator [Alphaproteobacteria bacterium]|nr:penicillin-binding protein activator [Alphaproteobacteria bacterium]
MNLLKRRAFDAACRSWVRVLPVLVPGLIVIIAAVGLSGCESSSLGGILQGDRVAVRQANRPPRPAPATAVKAGPSVVAFPRPGMIGKTGKTAAAPVSPPAAARKSGERPPSLIPYLTGQAQARRPPDLAPAERGINDSAAPPAGRELPPPAMKIADGVRAALLLPLSGRAARLGQAMLNAAQMALFAFADKKFELLFYDTLGTPEGAARAASQAIGDGASVILGPLFSASAMAVAPAARAANVTVISFSSDRQATGKGVYTIGFYPGDEVRRVASFALSRGLRRFAVLAPDDAYGKAVLAALRETITGGGGEISRVELYDPQTADYSTVVRRLANYNERRKALIDQIGELKKRDDEIARRAVRRLKKRQTIGELPFDALLVAAGGKRLQAIAALLPFYDVDPDKIRILGTGRWDEPGIGSEPALVGGWFAAPPPGKRNGFDRRYKKTYGKTPPRLVTLAYDATALAAVLARAGDGFGPETLTAKSGFAGRDGIFRFRLDGTSERGLAVIQIQPRGELVISKAPQNF